MSEPNSPRGRVAALLEVIYRLGEGDLTARGELSPEEDELDGLTAGLNMLAEELEEAAHARRVAERRLADEVVAYDNAPALFCSLDARTLRVVKSNAMLATALGYTKDELGEFCVLDLHAEGCRQSAAQAFQSVVEGVALAQTEFELLCRDGKRCQVELSASLARGERGDPDRIRVVWRDVTEQRQLERQLAQAQKLQAIGQLAGGIAHDFNNLLTVIIGASELALQTDTSTACRDDLLQIQAAARSGAELTNGLLAFSRRSVVQPKPTTLPRVIAGAKTLLSRLLDEAIKIVFLDAPDPWTVLVDSAQFEQVLINLSINARDSMPDGGTLTIETANVQLGPDYIDTHLHVTPGDYAMLAVSDTGTGMDAETRERAFEPFFTKKPRGKGTGLGLAICYGLIRQAGGSISLYSEPGQGTTVKLYLPRSGVSAEQSEPRPKHEPSRRAKGTILVVEDDEQVRHLTVRVVRSAGFTVIEAQDGLQAIERAKAQGRPVDLVLTDVIMPSMSGRELVDALLEYGFAKKALFVSGYTENSIAHHGVLDAGIEFLSKPFSPHALLDRINELLAEDASD